MPVVGHSGVSVGSRHFRRLIRTEGCLLHPVSKEKQMGKWRSSRWNVRLWLSRTYSTGRNPPWNVLFFGTDSVSLESLKVLNEDRLSCNDHVLKHLDVVTKKKVMKSPLAVRQYAEQHKLEVFDWPHCPANDRYDVGIVVSFGHLIPPDVIQAFPLGMLNVHTSLLPRWRGPAPVANAILAGDSETGVTIMQISPHEFDVGKILNQQSYAIPDDDTATTTSVTSTLARMGANLLLETLKDLRSYLETSKPQDSTLATKAPKLKPAHAVVKWDQCTCQYIDRLYRAMHDTLQLETTWHGVRVRMFNMVHPKEMLRLDVDRVIDRLRLPQQASRKPGNVLYLKNLKIIFVLCKDGWVGFNTILVKGHRTMSAPDFYNGFMTKVAVDQRYFE